MPPHKAAFDELAQAYDADFSYTPIGRVLRQRVWERLDRLFDPNDHVLELGCGTGEDTAYLAGRGVHVTATDASRQMCMITRQKAEGAVNVFQLDLHHLPDLGQARFDGVLSNFGVLNVLGEWHTLAHWLAGKVIPNGRVALGVMAPYCLWEFVWHMLHGDPQTATRRWRDSTVFQGTPNQTPIPIRYPTIRQLQSDFAPYFEQTAVYPLGLALPPSDVFGAVEARPKVMQQLIALDAFLSRFPALAPFADHYWIELRRTDAPAA